MKTKLIALLSVVAALVLGGVGTAQSADFTISVRVELSNLLPEVNSGRVRCVLGPGSGFPAANAIGFGDGDFGINPNLGTYSGTVTVPVSAHPGKDPAAARSYHCTLFLNGKVADFGSAKPNTTFTPNMSGALPQ